ncbi:MAG: hypothetical protein ABWX92_12400 [Mycetocola sp.]
MAIPAERLREGEQILTRGKISFSRLAALVEGEALAKSITQARARGALYPTDVPHTTVSLVDVQVIFANPAAPTPEELFVQEKFYTVKSGDNAGKQGFNIDNKSTFLPTVLEADPENPGQYRQLVLERDLASGVDVTLVLQVFKPAKYEKRGLGLQQVVLMEAPRYFSSSGVDANALAARGIVVNGPIRPITAPAPAAAGAPLAPAAAIGDEYAVPANSQADANGFVVPTPGAQGVIPAPSVAAQAFPVSAPAVAYAQPAAPVAQVAPAAPVAQVAPVQAETQAETIARLQQQLAEQNVALAGSGSASAFDAPALVGAGVGGASPWDVAGQGAPAFQG